MEKAPSSSSSKEFQARFAAAAGHVEWYTLPWRMALAVSMLETGNGSNGLTKNANNLFSIKVGSGWKTGGWRGKVYMNNGAEFRAYDSWEDSMKDFVRLMNFDIYKGALQAASFDDAEGFFRELKSARYDASLPQYAVAAFNRYKEVAV